MLVVETIARIRRDHLVKGVAIKKLARDLRVSKNTIRKVVRGDATSHTYARKIQPMPKLGPWVGELERQLKANEKKQRRDRLSLLQIHEDLGELGYKGGYDAVRRYARAWRRRRRLLSPSQAFVPLIFDPGEAYQFDWSHEYARLSGATTRVKAARMRLCHSRMYLVQVFPRESQEMVIEAHERAFRFFGGVCRRGIYDNMKTAVSTVFVGKKRDYNRRFQVQGQDRQAQSAVADRLQGHRLGLVLSLDHPRRLLALYHRLETLHDDADRRRHRHAGTGAQGIRLRSGEGRP